ncbi:MAG: glycosyltransferase [Planctomycetota bacterium]|nr:glycosyltransferase [Planctomycetota bacterium]
MNPTGRDIAFLLGYPEISGGTNVIMEHALGLTRRGHRVSIVTEKSFDPSRLSWKPGASDLPLLNHQQCRDRPFDLVLATWWRSMFDLPHVAARKYAYFVQSIESRFFPESQPDMKALAEFTYRMPLPIVTEATWIKRHLEQIYGRTCSLVLNGIDKQSFSSAGPAIEPRPSEGLRVLVEGPLKVPFKRVELAVDLCRQAGISDLWMLTSSECASFPGVSRVFSRVPVTKVGEIYRSCDVLVKLSTVEGMFGPPLEMFHCGGTAIVTDVTGHDEYIKHGHNAVVVRRGHEAEVVGYLQALQRDRRFLDHLKAGALATAAQWPTWETAVEGMEQFCEQVISGPPTPDQARHDTMLLLRGALRLAGPLHEAIRRDHSGRELLRRAKDKAIKKLARSLPGARSPEATETALVGVNAATKKAVTPGEHPGDRAPMVDVKPIVFRGSPPPRPVNAAPTESRRPDRVCFVGRSTGQSDHESHVPASCQSLSSVFLDLDRASPSDLASIERWRPTCVFAFDADELSPEQMRTLTRLGPVLGHSRTPLTPERLARLRSLFPQAGRAQVLHLDSALVDPLLRGGVRCAGPFLLPIDTSRWALDDSFEAWSRRSMDAMTIATDRPGWRSSLAVLASVQGFTRVEPPRAASITRALLADSRVVVFLPRAPDDPHESPEVLRALSMGCLVVAPRLRVDYGLLASEHLVTYTNAQELREVVQRCIEAPDEQDVIRRTGFLRAQEFCASAAFATLIKDRFPSEERVR